jgi:hypothetical protein
MKVIAFNIVAVLCVLLLFEAGLQVLAISDGSGSGVDPTTSRAAEHPDLGFVGNPAFNEHDDRGFRNERALDDAEFVVIGDSHVYGTGVESHQKWSTILEEETGRTGYNVSFGGFSPYKNRENFALSMTLHPAIIFYGFYFGNDLYEDFFHFFYHFPESSSAGDCGDMVYCAPALHAERLSSSQEYLSELTMGLFGRGERAENGQPNLGSPVRDLKRFLADNSEVYRVLRSSRNALRSLVRPPERGVDRIMDRLPAGQRQMACPVVGKWSSIMTSYYRGYVVDETNPRIQFGFELTEHTLAGFAEQASARGIDFYVVMLPTKEFVFDRAGIDVGDCPGMEDLVRGEQYFRERLVAALEARGIPYVDPLARLVASAEPPYFDGLDGHPNPTGHRIIAEAVLEGAFLEAAGRAAVTELGGAPPWRTTVATPSLRPPAANTSPATSLPLRGCEGPAPGRSCPGPKAWGGWPRK